MLHTLSLVVLLFAVWLLLSGQFSILLLGLGVASTALVVFLVRRMDVADHEGHPVHLIWRLVLYAPWLVKEIFKANIDVARTIINPKLPISPGVISLNGSQVTELGQVAYANSITLTPGTVTIGLEDALFTVHALTTGAGEDLSSGEMDRRVTAMEGTSASDGESR